MSTGEREQEARDEAEFNRRSDLRGIADPSPDCSCPNCTERYAVPSGLTFTLTIELGNEGTQGDVRRALRAVGKRLDYHGDAASILASGQGDPIHDLNGMTVGSWGVK